MPGLAPRVPELGFATEALADYVKKPSRRVVKQVSCLIVAYARTYAFQSVFESRRARIYICIQEDAIRIPMVSCFIIH